jgi:hypothetical protein
VLPLHGSLSGEQQRKVFDRPPAGHRKVRGCVLLGGWAVDVVSWGVKLETDMQQGGNCR